MLLSGLASAPARRPRATRSEYVADWLAARDDDDGPLLSATGDPVLPEDALRCAVVYRAVNVLAHAIASIPLVIYRRMPNGGKERAPDHPMYRTLHDKPNAWQTSWSWRQLMMTRAVLWGNAFHQVLPGPGGPGQIVPLNPKTTRVADQLTNGKLLYVTRDFTKAGLGPERRLIQDDVLHIPGFSLDGKQGIPLAEFAKNAIGLSLSAERHGAMFMRNSARPSGILTAPGTLDDEARAASEKSWNDTYGKSSLGAVPLLEGGIKFDAVSVNHRDSQWLEARTFEVEELLRYLGVPGVLCGYADKTATYASAEQFFLSFVTYTVQPWTENISACLNMSVVTDAENYFAAFVLEGLLRGDIKTRYAAHQSAVNTGWKTRNEVRVEENYNPSGPELDVFLEPLAMGGAGDGALEAADGGQQGKTAARPSPRPGATAAAAALAQVARLEKRARAVAKAAAVRILRRELGAIVGTEARRGAAHRLAADPKAWKAWLAEFYADHVDFVVEALGVSRAQALAYCDSQRTAALAGVAALLGGLEVEAWEAEHVPALVSLVLEEAA
jgi:HK97 family phage portal protein